MYGLYVPPQANRSLNVASVKAWKYLPPGDEQALEDAVATIGPVAVVIDTTTRNFQFYRRGVFYDPKCSIWKQAHAVLLVGFGSEGQQEYWTIKNRKLTNRINIAWMEQEHNKHLTQ
ncbi:procathepsin L-like [Alosa sapidissima]|uniref:procathepsin L-like n=1 Tax=Alosa sapidissima TaxID=34773 RepID=UPI001C09F2C8|nr:procathepsin L-like [Alosa sapidissima]